KGAASLDELAAGNLVDGGLVELHDGSYRLTAEGKSKGEALLASDRQSWGAGRAASALGGFHALDQRMKEGVTAWQLREDGGAQAINDHSDAADDARVLNRTATLHKDV